MNRAAQISFVAVAAGLSFAATHYFVDEAPRRDTADLNCIFKLAPDAHPVPFPRSSEEIALIKLAALLTSRSEEDGVELWHGEATATFGSRSLPLSGVTFTTSSGKVRGIGYWPEAQSGVNEQMRISTLNDQGMLDWNDATAYVYFENEPNKLRYPFTYECQVKRNEAQ